VIRLDEVFFVLSVVVPGLIYIHYGRRILRTDWLAIRTWKLILPYIIFLLFLAAGAYVFETDEGSAGDDPYADPPAGISIAIDWIRLILLLPLALYFYFISSMGSILIFGGRRDIVLKAVQEILEKSRVRYNLDGDSFRILSEKARIEIHWSETKDTVGIQRWSWDFRWKAWFDESIIRTFTGRPSERTRPALMGFGVFLVVLGIVLAGILSIG